MKAFLRNLYFYFEVQSNILLKRELKMLPFRFFVIILFFLAVLFDVILYYFYGTDLITVIRRFIQNPPNALY